MCTKDVYNHTTTVPAPIPPKLNGKNKYIDTQHHEGVSETYFKKETAGWQKPGREAALVSLGKGSLRAQRELAGSHGGEKKRKHMIIKN